MSSRSGGSWSTLFFSLPLLGMAAMAFFGVPDSNDSGSGGEVAVLGINDSGIVRAQVKKISDATPVSIIRFDSNYPPIDAIVVNGTAGTGRTEIAVIGANATNQYQLQIKDLMTGDPVRVGLVP